jgi:hypothetical protein
MARAVAATAFVAVWLVGSGAAAHAATPKATCVIAVNDDSYTTPEGTPLVVADPGVVTNDSICGTDGLVISVTQPSFGSLGGTFDDADGGFTYTPDPGYAGPDSFTYKLEDVDDSPVATVHITVTPSCTVVVRNDEYQTIVNTPLVVPDPGIVGNDTGCGNNETEPQPDSGPSHGTVTFASDRRGGFTYTPDAGFTGSDTFTYELEEGSPVGTVLIDVVPTSSTVPVTSTTTTVAATTTTNLAGVAPASTVPPPTTTPALARTGSPVTGSALLGVGLVSIGLALVLLGRRRTMYTPRHSRS